MLAVDPAADGRPDVRLAQALGIGDIATALDLAAPGAGLVAGTGLDAVGGPSPTELLAQASRGEWPTVACYLASDPEALPQRLTAVDVEARRKLRRLAGFVRVRLPRDLRWKFIDGGRLPQELLVEDPRWLLPRPAAEDSFVSVEGVEARGAPGGIRRVEPGWHSVVQYPVDDDLREADLRRKLWTTDNRQDAAFFLQNEGETLFCKAVKAGQWDIVRWMLEHGDTAALARQLQYEYVGLWDVSERYFYIQTLAEVQELCQCMDEQGVLQRAWGRGTRFQVPAKATLRAPEVQALRHAARLAEEARSDPDGLGGSAAFQVLERLCNRRIIFTMMPSLEARKAWLADLQKASADRSPLTHRLILSNCPPQLKGELVKVLLDSTVDPDAVDGRGLSALAAAAAERQWDVAEALLEAGCRTDGRSGALALAAAERASKASWGGATGDLAATATVSPARAAAVLEKLQASRSRASAASLEDFFRRQAQGEFMLGREPRRFQLGGEGVLRPRGRAGDLGGPRIWSKALLLDSPMLREDCVVRFARVSPEDYRKTVDSGQLELRGLQLWRERSLNADSIAVLAVVAPPNRMSAEVSGMSQALPLLGLGPLAALPILAQAPPSASLRVQSQSRCCGAAVGRVEVFVGGVAAGETPAPSPMSLGDAQSSEMEISLPLRQIEVVMRLSGCTLLSQMLPGDPYEELLVEAPVVVYFYVQRIDEALEFVFVCGHRRDLPEDATPYVGQVEWTGEAGSRASTSLTTLEGVMLGSQGCLNLLKSVALTPQLPPGWSYEAVEWADTGDCQFQRILVNPVRVGKYSRGGG